MAHKALPEWVNVIKKIFDKIENNVQNAKDDNLQARPPGGVINFIKSSKLIEEIACCKIIHEEALERITSIRDDIGRNISQEMLTPNQVEVLNILFMVEKSFNGKTKFVKANNDVFEKESNIARQKFAKQPDTTDMRDLEDEESAAQERQVAKSLKTLTPNQILNRIPVSLAQLKRENNSEKLKNEIRQLLHSLYRSKKVTKQLYKNLIDIF